MTEKKNLQFTIITGLSGAGRSEAVKSFEDMGYFCIDNLPPRLLATVADLCAIPGSKIDKVAVVCDVRGGDFFDELFGALGELKRKEVPHEIMYLEASDAELVKRFKETRRRHPLAETGQVLDGIRAERHLMEPLRGAADMVIDTTDLEAYQLKEKIRSAFLGGEYRREGLLISVISFGYKYGVPADADFVVDVRFLPNPHYIERLRPFTGRDPKVRSFVMKRPETKEFLGHFLPTLAFLIPNYMKEGKTHFTIAVGCTGGTHRSVALADRIAKYLKKEGYHVIARHRDIGRETTGA